MNWRVLANNLEREVASLGFVSDPQPRKPTSFAGVKRIRHYSKGDQAYHSEYHRRQRQRWLLLGIVKPKNDQEREFVAQQQKGAQ